MKYFGSLILGLSLTLAPWGHAAAPSPLITGTPAAADATEPKLFRSRIDGIEFYPPAGGTMMRGTNTGEIVRFVYTDTSWDVRVKPILLAKPMPLSSPQGDGGILELTVTQLVDSNQAAVVLTREVRPMGRNSASVGLIETRYAAGTNNIFAQEAIVQDTQRHYFAVQMSSPGKSKDAPANVNDPQEEQARRAFAQMVQSVQILDRAELGKEQIARLKETQMLWVSLDKKKLIQTLIPLHFMRVLRDGKDIGFIQVDERLATHSGHEGIEYIVHSRVETGAEQPGDGLHPGPVPVAAPNGAHAGESSPGNIVVPGGLNGPTTAPASAGRPLNMYTNSTYFVTFDRDHEDWITTTQIDQQVNNQFTEMANSDRLEKLRLDAAELARQMKNTSKGKDRQPPTTQSADYTLDVSQYTHGGHVGKPIHAQLPPFYLPQATGQLLARLLPPDPAKYLFATYVSNQKNVMARYIDVDQAREVVLDDQTVRAIPVSDRIGADGIPTVHYVTRQGEWLGSVNEESKLVVLPTDEKTLTAIWKDSQGFKVCPPPPLPEEAPVVKKSTSRKPMAE